jgi:carboxymethylenebutenolidase
VDAEEAHHLMTNLDWPNAKAELVECARYLKATGSPKVGVVGFCMGGALALIAAQHADDVTCAAPFYGTPDPGICQTEKISKPVQAHFGELDNLAGFSDPDAATKLLANLQAAGGDCELHTYPNVGHAFMNDTPDPYATWEARRKAQGFPPYDETQVNLAWSRLLRFFEKHLVG